MLGATKSTRRVVTPPDRSRLPRAGIATGALLLALSSVYAACGRVPAASPSPGRSSATPTPTAVVLARYTNPAYPYELGYPAGWQPVTSNPDSIHFDGASGRRISVEARPVPPRQPAFTPATFADAQVEALRTPAQNLVELQRTRVGLPEKGVGIEVDVTWSEGGAQHRALLLYVLDASIAFVVRAEAPPSAFPSDRRVLEASLRSFTLTPPD